MKKARVIAAVFLAIAVFVSFTACGSKVVDSGDPEYEAKTILVKGLPDGDKEISVAEMRKLEQHDLDASFKRTTGLIEEYDMSGPYLADVISYLGADITDYEAVGVMGNDAYYYMLDADVIKNTPDLMLAMVVDGEVKLEEGLAPAWLAVQGQFGPYWVKKISEITLYTTIPEKNIENVWVFENFADGMETYDYEYYGSKDKSISVNSIISRLDYVNSQAFFTMKSSDGFKKQEALSMLLSDYYIKIEGVDAPTNMSPYSIIGQNVKDISWFSTNADALFFYDQLKKYMDTSTINGKEGITLSEIMFETEVKELKGNTYYVFDKSGDRQQVKGEDLYKGILVPENGKYRVYWEDGVTLKTVDNLLRVSLDKSGSDAE